MTPITYLPGDATTPIGQGAKIIAHCCNDCGAWGAGFVLALSKKWRGPEAHFRRNALTLGLVAFIEVADGIMVANIIGQHGIGPDASGRPPIRYDALRQGFVEVSIWAKADNASVHMPRIGCGLAGGDWNAVEAIIAETLCAHDVSVFVYDLPKAGGRNQ